MLFNKIEFLFFLPIVFFLYWFIANRSVKIQNVFLILASYVFYGWWDWRFLALLSFSSTIDYLVGLGLMKSEDPRKRKHLLWISLGVNLGLLGFFKYYNFFLDSFISAYSFMGQDLSVDRLNIILPVGISFYTFQTLSYTVDVYKKKLQPTTDPVAFFAFVSFFPQLVAGPIERARNLLPQFDKKRSFDLEKSRDGLRQILWGLFKKVVIADNCAHYVNIIFTDYQDASGSTLYLGLLFFMFQIYGDFSGYSDIAIGTARLFGFNLMKNFNYPYFARDIAEFWRRWHISLTTWFRDYLFLPMSIGKKNTLWLKVKNTLIIYFISGLWHGADWTYVVWGLIHGVLFIPYFLKSRGNRNTGRISEGRFIPTFSDFRKIIFTFVTLSFTGVFFRAQTFEQASVYLKNIFQSSFFTLPTIWPISLLLVISLFMLVEWVQREKDHGLYLNHLKMARPIRWSIYLVLIVMVYTLKGHPQQYIYFQF